MTLIGPDSHWKAFAAGTEVFDSGYQFLPNNQAVGLWAHAALGFTVSVHAALSGVRG